MWPKGYEFYTMLQFRRNEARSNNVLNTRMCLKLKSVTFRCCCTLRLWDYRKVSMERGLKPRKCTSWCSITNVARDGSPLVRRHQLINISQRMQIEVCVFERGPKHRWPYWRLSFFFKSGLGDICTSRSSVKCDSTKELWRTARG